MNENFVSAVKNYLTLTRTENNALAYSTTGNALLDLFASVGAMRTKSTEEIVERYVRAFETDPLLATKLAFYARNVRGGLGERRVFRVMISTLAVRNPAIVKKNLALIPHFGRWDDLYSLIGTRVETSMWDFIRETIQNDLENMNANKPVSLCAKWLKSTNTSSKASTKLGRKTAENLYMSEKEYRKMLSKLRGYINVTEKLMSANAWSEINYEIVPSRAMLNYKSAFAKRNPEAFEKFVEKVQSGEAKIKASTLYPYDILQKANLRVSHNYYDRITPDFLIDHDVILEEQWKALPDYVNGEHSALVMADTSGSMESNNGLPMATSIGLALYFAERNKGAFHNLFMTFSHEPEFIDVKGNTLREKISGIRSIVANTNLEKAFELILNLAVANNVPNEDLPSTLIVISDMQFDEAVRNSPIIRQYGGSPSLVFFDKMKVMFEEQGYTMPTVIFWNVDEKRQTYQAKAGTDNVMLVSGHSPSMFKSVLGSVGRTPYDFMVEVLNSPEYEAVVI